ncbi:MAG: hypothetical protein NVSMB62_18610 [Acidobacteriaceae bacterium]
MNTLDDVSAGAKRRTLRENLKHWAGLDRAIAFTVMARCWSAFAGVVTILLIARFLSPREQGYYFTFSSLVALQIVFELGFSFVILQLAAHERAQLTFLPDGRVDGSPIAYSRLASVLQKSVRWYSVAGVLMAAALLPAGLYFFSTHQPGSAEIHWRLPWCLLVICASVTFQLDPVFSFLEGCGSVLQVAQMRLGQAALGSVLAWAAMALHHGLFSPAMLILGQAAVGAGFLLMGSRRSMLKQLLAHATGEHRIGWRREIWPFQWRIAISWLCGYFIFQLFNPVLFAFQGPISAGRMGMSLSIASSIGAVAIAWMNTKASPFGNLIARGEIKELDTLFFRTLWQSTVLLAAGASAFFVVLLIVESRLPRYASRVLPPWAFGLLLLTTIMNHVVFCEALYLRAHKREPFLGITIIAAILLAAATLVLGKVWGANAVTVGYFAITAIFGLPSGTYIFLTKRREWHSQTA